MEKLLLMQVAATQAAAVLASYAPSTPLPIDAANPGKITDEMKLRNLIYWELFRIFYACGLQVDQDHASWPDPPTATAQRAAGAVASAVSSGAGAAQALATLATGTSPLALAVQNLLKTVPAVSAAVAGPIAGSVPNPMGVTTPAAAIPAV
jgi:hypothetical protein